MKGLVKGLCLYAATLRLISYGKIYLSRNVYKKGATQQICKHSFNFSNWSIAESNLSSLKCPTCGKSTYKFSASKFICVRLKEKPNTKKVKTFTAKTIYQKTKKILVPARSKWPVVARYHKWH